MVRFWNACKVAVLGVGLSLSALALPVQAQTTGFDTDTFVTGVDVEGQLETAMTSMSTILLYVIGAMLALAVISAVVMWARKTVKSR